MMKKYILQWLILPLLLTSCGTLPPPPTATSAPTLTPVPPTATVLPTETPAPTLTLTPTVTIWPTPNADQLALISRLRMVYTKDGNLYIQDGTNAPRQLTSSGLDREPIISDDGQKIVFYRRLPTEPDQVYSISADGSQEQPVITRSILNALNLGYFDPDYVRAEYVVFVPGTHLLLFDTMMISPEQASSGSGAHTSYDDLLVVDTDTAKIKHLFGYMQVYQFNVSPNGKLIAIQTTDRVKIIDITGRVVRTLLTYDIYNGHGWKEGELWREFRLNFYWTGDSSALFVFIPRDWDEVDYDYHFALYNVWKYPLNGASPVKINLAPSPSIPQEISPDGKWLVYYYAPQLPDYYITDADRSFEPGIYMANLQDGSTKFLTNESNFFYNDLHWSPDSAHFGYYGGFGDEHEYFGNLVGEITPKEDVQSFFGWVDGNHYLFGKAEMGAIDKEMTLRLVESAGLGAGFNAFRFIVLKPAIEK